VDELRLVGHDHEALGHGGHDLLPCVGAPAALRQVQVPVDLVGAVDGDVERSQLVGCHDLQTDGHGQRVRAHRRGRAHDIGPALAQRPDRPVDRRSGPEAHTHAVDDIACGVPAGLFLGVLLAAHGGQLRTPEG
jgi:hypothetical protein